MARVTIVIPTIPGREEHYQRCLFGYMQHHGGHMLEIIPEFGHPTVGCAWQAGASKASGDYIHLTNDDIEPHAGWLDAAIEACDRGFIPGPAVYGPAGDPQYPPVWGQDVDDWTPLDPPHAVTVPFMSYEQWKKIGPLLQSHYYADNWIADRARFNGWTAVVRTGYKLTHHWAQPGRGAGMTENERMAYDQQLYAIARANEAAGLWVHPWPDGGRA